MSVDRAFDLMPGEDPRTEFLDDAEHWIAVYEELVLGLRGEQSVGETVRKRQADLLARLEYWRRRQKDLRARARVG